MPHVRRAARTPATGRIAPGRHMCPHHIMPHWAAPACRAASATRPSAVVCNSQVSSRLLTNRVGSSDFPPGSVALVDHSPVRVSRVNFHSPSPPPRLQQSACPYFEFNSAQSADYLRITTSSTHERFDCSAPESTPTAHALHCPALSALPTYTPSALTHKLCSSTLSSAHTLKL